MLSWKVGEVKITRVQELELPGLQWILPDATPENLATIPWLKPHFVDDSGEAVAAVQTFVVEAGDRRILVDTCIGNDKDLPLKFWRNLSGPFLQDLEKAGFPADSIDTVLCTHLHVDHVGWNTRKENGKWVPTFPKARYLFGRVEWEHWDANREGMEVKVLEESVDPIVQAGLHELVEVDEKIGAEIQLEPTPGHTPGHVSVRIRSDGQEAVITGDLMHHPAQFVQSGWSCTADFDKEEAIATRRGFIERFAGTPTLVIGSHFATPTAGKIVEDGDAYRFEVE